MQGSAGWGKMPLCSAGIPQIAFQISAFKIWRDRDCNTTLSSPAHCVHSRQPEPTPHILYFSPSGFSGTHAHARTHARTHTHTMTLNVNLTLTFISNNMIHMARYLFRICTHAVPTNSLKQNSEYRTTWAKKMWRKRLTVLTWRCSGTVKYAWQRKSASWSGRCK